MSKLSETCTLFEAVNTALNLLHPSIEITECDRLFDEAEELVLAALRSDRLGATGFPRKPIYSATGQTHSREPIPSRVWELATTKPDEHRLRGRHYVGYLNDIDRRQDCGVLTFSGDADPSWIRIRVDSTSLRALFEEVVEGSDAGAALVEVSDQPDAHSPFKRPVLDIVESALAEWHRTGRSSRQPTQDAMVALVGHERPAASREEVRAAFHEAQKRYPDVKWSKTGPRRAL